MSTKAKLVQRVLSIPSDLTYDELKTFLEHYGYYEDTRGKTSGSRVVFLRKKDNSNIFLHKPHPTNIVGQRTLKEILKKLKEQKDLK